MGQRDAIRQSCLRQQYEFVCQQYTWAINCSIGGYFMHGAQHGQRLHRLAHVVHAQHGGATLRRQQRSGDAGGNSRCWRRRSRRAACRLHGVRQK